MGNEWKRCELGDVISINPVRSLSKGADSVYISMQQVETENRSINEIAHRPFQGSGSRFQNGDTLLARITPCLENGKTAYVDFLDDKEVGHGSTEFIVLSGIEGVTDDLFVYYLSRLPQFRSFAIARMEGSSGRQRVPASTLKKYSFECPPTYDEQRAIAHIFGSLDDKIEINRQMNETLEAMVRTVFKSWFVDFDPVRAKAEGRDTGLPEEIAALFPDSFEDSELGEIPKGWTIGNMDNICTICSGKRPPDKVIFSSKKYSIPVYGGNGISWFTSDYLYNPPLVVTGRVGTLGTSFLVRENVWVSDNALSIFPNEISDEKFIYLLIPYLNLENLNSGSTQPLLTQNALKRLRIILPDLRVMKKFSSFTENLFSKIDQNKIENIVLSSLRDTLLPKLISGELRVPDAEKFIEEAGV